MVDMISNAEKIGEKKAEIRIRKLIGLLYEESKIEDVKRIANDEGYLKELYRRYNL